MRDRVVNRRLRAALVVPYYDPRVGGDPAVRLARFPTVPELAAELRVLGLDVQVYHLSNRNAVACWSGVQHHFVATGPARRFASRLVWRRAPRFAPPYYEPAFGLVQRVFDDRPDVVHVFGLNLDLNVWLLARAAARRNVPLVAHFHGGVPASDRWTRWLQCASIRRMARVLFTHPQQAAPWCAVGLTAYQVGVVTETSTRMRRAPRPRDSERSANAERRSAGFQARPALTGDPACVLVGRLHAVKDPLTALTAFALAAEKMPAARLHVFGAADSRFGHFPALVRSVSGLSDRVVFNGYTKSRRLANCLASADILLQASRREWSSLSVLEALAMGVVPVVTNIPAFRALTDDGRVGRLVPLGDARAMADAVIALATDRAELARLSRAGRDWFDARLSFRALARDVASVYGGVVAEEGLWPKGKGHRTRRSAMSTKPPAS